MQNKGKIDFFINLLIFIILLVLLISINSDNPKDKFLKKIINTFSSPFQYRIKAKEFDKNRIKLSEYSSINDIINENIDLKKQLEEEKLKNKLMEEISKENTKLSEIINLKEQYSEFKSQPAEIVETINKEFEKSAIINIGKNYNIEKNMIVLSANGLFGKVVEVYENKAKVQKINDPSSNVLVNILGEKETGVLRGSINSNLILTMINKEDSTMDNREVYTSGDSGIFPKGIYVGKVERMVYEKNALDTYALLEKRSDLDKARRVLVLKGAKNE